MATMNAALVTSFYEPPHLQRMAIPSPRGDEQLVDVVAAALHPQVRDAAAGANAEELGDPPLVPGIDAVGRRDDGTLIYFLATNDIIGTMAERAIAHPRRSIELPVDVDAPAIAAAMFPALLSGVSFTDLPAVIARIVMGDVAVQTRTVALREVERFWLLPDVPAVCTVVLPSPQ